MPPRSRLVWLGPGLLIAGLAAGAAAAGPKAEVSTGASPLPEGGAVVSLQSLLEEMVGRGRLARLPQPEYRTGQASSYDRRSVAPFHAEPRWDGNSKAGYVTVTRTRSLDAIAFASRLQLDMEIWHWSATTMACAATTYWYARPGAVSNRVPEPDQARRPIPPGGEIVEGEAMEIRTKTGGVTELQTEARWSGAGKHRFVAEIVGTNPAAKPRFMLGLDFLRLEPQE